MRLGPCALCTAFFGFVIAACSSSKSQTTSITHDPLEHCTVGHVGSDRRDDTISDTPVKLDLGNGRYDLSLPTPVLDWIDEQGWPQQHADWHNIRRWDEGCRQLYASPTSCPSAARMAKRGLWRADKQESSPGDGYAFLVMHRHMILNIKQAFPKHAKLFAGFRHIPLTQDDPENPWPWSAPVWATNWLTAIDVLDHIESNLDRFPTEDSLGTYIQAITRWNKNGPADSPPDVGKDSGIHNGALHIQWGIPGSPVQLTDSVNTIYNYVFWKLHGWIDNVWERYRVARHITDSDPAYVEEMYNQCKEMVELDASNLVPQPTLDAGGDAATETGFFATQVRPILETNCSGCHGAQGPQEGLTLGGANVSSAEVMAGLVGVEASETAMKRVTAGDSSNSWLYRKITGDFTGITCTGSLQCETQMPAAGPKLSSDNVAIIKQWIDSGATAK